MKEGFYNAKGIPKRLSNRINATIEQRNGYIWGDLAAVSEAYGVDLQHLAAKRKYRNPDSIDHPKKELKRYLPELTQIDGTRRISPHMNLEENTSRSFQVFLQGVKKICGIVEQRGI